MLEGGLKYGYTHKFFSVSPGLTRSFSIIKQGLSYRSHILRMHSTSLWLFAPWATSEQKSSKCRQRQLISILSIKYNFAKTNCYNQSLQPASSSAKGGFLCVFSCDICLRSDRLMWLLWGFFTAVSQNSVNEKLLGLFWEAKEHLCAAEFHRAVIRPVIGLGDLKTAKIERCFRSQRLLLTDTTFQSRENIP